MKLHTVFVTHNRLELTQQAVASWKATCDAEATYLIVDNASTDGTIKWLVETDQPCLLLAENYFPGYATNRGWELAPSDATHYQRADNDFAFLPGWTREVRKMFMRERKLGQLGLRTAREENYTDWNTGGNCVIDARVFQQVRWREEPWGDPAYPVGWSEDSFFSNDVAHAGWTWTRVRRPCIQNLATGDWRDPYYQESYGVRGITPHPDDPTAPGTV